MWVLDEDQQDGAVTVVCVRDNAMSQIPIALLRGEVPSAWLPCFTKGLVSRSEVGRSLVVH